MMLSRDRQVQGRAKSHLITIDGSAFRDGFEEDERMESGNLEIWMGKLISLAQLQPAA